MRPVLISIFVCMLSMNLYAGEFKPYAGALVDEKASKSAQNLQELVGTDKTKKVTVYFTKDSFDTVVAFYSKIGKEYLVPGRKKGQYRKMSPKQDIKEAFYIFDGAADLTISKDWIKIQRPYYARTRVKGKKTIYDDVRQRTAIFRVEKP